MDTIQDKFSGNFSNRAAQKAVIAQARKDDNSPMIKDYTANFLLPASWQSLQISTKINEEEVVQDISILTPVKVQFLLQYWDKQIVETLRARQIELDQEKSNFEKIYIKENSSNRKGSPDVIRVAINALEENLDDIVVRSLKMSAGKQAQILLSTVYTKDLAAKKVALYKQKSDGICLVGFKDGVLQTYDVINSLFTNNTPCARHVRISFFDAQLFAKLKFIEHTKKVCSSKIDISIDTKNQIILMNKASVSDVHDVVDKINAFRKGVVQTEFNTTRAKAALLRLNETQKSFEEIFKNENLNCYVNYGSELVHIHTRTDEDGEIAAMIMETSLQEITVRNSFAESEEFFIILEKFKGKILIEHSENIYTCKISCTNDALADISMALVNKDHPKFLNEKKTEEPCNKENGGIATFGQMYFDRKPNQIQKELSKQQNRNTDEKKKFTTKEKIDIYVYSESILQLDVDCIVNEANERLGHRAGVAAVIASAAGYELEQEGKEYIERYGPIPVGECFHTTAGRLPYKYVIHTVGPRWSNSMTLKEQKQCKKELQSAIESCFYEADILRMKSIGVPSVSAGIFGMPPYICAKQYLEAVLNYSQQRTWSSKPTTLKEIHFIDMNIEMCKQIADVFSKCGDFKEAGLSVGSKPSNISTSSRHSFSHSSYSRSLSNSSFDRNDDEAYSSSVEMLFRPCSWITIHLLQSSITDIKKVSAVVSPENLGFKHQGRISKAILDKADEDFRDKVEVMKDRPTSITSVFSVDCSKEMPWKCVLYSIAPRLDSKYKQNIQQFETDLKDTVVNILSEAAIKGLESLAIPLLGTAVTGTKTPMDSCCRSMLDGIWRMINKETRKKNWKLDLWIVTTDQDAINTFEKMLNTKTGSKLRNSNPDLGSSKLENQKTDGKTLDEDCCICMDKITDPKWLPCKHVFCKDCIDQQFTFKPACPQCGAVHGIVTGDQPPGRISIIKQYNSLPGYPECQTIAITYTFRSGYQSEEHPNPGQPYTGITRTGYLPDNEKGRLVAKLLQVAFDRRLVFTIGRSRTTGQEGVITWNDIHHKTRTYGGQQSFGYPDDTYLDRVLDELAAKGVTKDSINE